MAILPIPAEKRDRDDRTRLMVPFENPPFLFKQYDDRNPFEAQEKKSMFDRRNCLSFDLDFSPFRLLPKGLHQRGHCEGDERGLEG